MSKLKDFTSTNNPKYLYLAELRHPFPAWIAENAVLDAEDMSKKASTAFADVKRRLLPVSDKISTFYSCINLYAEPHNYSEEVFNRVKAASAAFGIDNDLLPYMELFLDEVEKSAAVSDSTIPGEFAINTELEGQTFRLLPINDALEVDSSAKQLCKMASDRRIHYLQLLEASRNICKAAADKGVTKLPALIERLGVDRYDDVDVAKELVRGRHQNLDEETTKQATHEYLDIIKEWESGLIDADTCVEKIAANDDYFGVRHKFSASSDTLLPHEIVFCGPTKSYIEKLARENVVLRGIQIPKEAFDKLDRKDVEFKLSKAASDSLLRVIDETDASDISIALHSWGDEDQKDLLRLLANT